MNRVMNPVSTVQARGPELVMCDWSRVVVPDCCIILKVYGCCYDEEPVALVYVEELKKAA